MKRGGSDHVLSREKEEEKEDKEEERGVYDCRRCSGIEF